MGVRVKRGWMSFFHFIVTSYSIVSTPKYQNVKFNRCEYFTGHTDKEFFSVAMQTAGHTQINRQETRRHIERDELQSCSGGAYTSAFSRADGRWALQWQEERQRVTKTHSGEYCAAENTFQMTEGGNVMMGEQGGFGDIRQCLPKPVSLKHANVFSNNVRFLQ